MPPRLLPTPKSSKYVEQFLAQPVDAFGRGAQNAQFAAQLAKGLEQGFANYMGGKREEARSAELAQMLAASGASQDPRIAMGPVPATGEVSGVSVEGAYAPPTRAQRLDFLLPAMLGSQHRGTRSLGQELAFQEALREEEKPEVDYGKILASVPTHAPDITRQTAQERKKLDFGGWDQRTALEDGGGDFEVVAGQPLSAVQRLIAEREAITAAKAMTPELSLQYSGKIDALGKRDIKSVDGSLIDVTDADNPQVIYHSSKDGRDIRSVPGVGLFDFNDIDSEGMPKLIVESLIRGRYKNLGPYLDPDGKYLGEGTIDTATTDLNARRFLEKWDPDTKQIVTVPIPPDAQPRTEGYFNLGVPTFGQFGKLKEDLVGDETSLLNLASYLGNQDTSEIGWRRVSDQLSAWYKTFFSSNAKRLNLTEKELALKVAEGELEGLLGKFRIETVGGGVMTEIDALRIIRNLGGRVDALQNPEIVKRQVTRLFVNKHRLYTSHLEQYNAAVEARYKDLGNKRKTSITEGEGAINIDLFDEKLLSEAGITNTVQIDWDKQVFDYGDVQINKDGAIIVFDEGSQSWMPAHIDKNGVIQLGQLLDRVD